MKLTQYQHNDLQILNRETVYKGHFELQKSLSATNCFPVK